MFAIECCRCWDIGGVVSGRFVLVLMVCRKYFCRVRGDTRKSFPLNVIVSESFSGDTANATRFTYLFWVPNCEIDVFLRELLANVEIMSVGDVLVDGGVLYRKYFCERFLEFIFWWLGWSTPGSQSQSPTPRLKACRMLNSKRDLEVLFIWEGDV